VRLFSGTLEDVYRIALQITDAVQVDLGGFAILMPD
jgi:hypothetical protein